MDVGVNCLLSPMNTMAMSPTVVVGTIGMYLNCKLVMRYLSNDLAKEESQGKISEAPALTLYVYSWLKYEAVDDVFNESIISECFSWNVAGADLNSLLYAIGIYWTRLICWTPVRDWRLRGALMFLVFRVEALFLRTARLDARLLAVVIFFCFEGIDNCYCCFITGTTTQFLTGTDRLRANLWSFLIALDDKSCSWLQGQLVSSWRVFTTRSLAHFVNPDWGANHKAPSVACNDRIYRNICPMIGCNTFWPDGASIRSVCHLCICLTLALA